MRPRLDRVLFGAAYYHKYQPSPRLDADLDLMAAAHFSVIRVGESVWSTWEPEDGEFDTEWLAPVLDGAAQRGMSVVLGTPTYAAPPWLARKYPEIAGESAAGVRVPWGGRQEMDYTHPAFLFHAERVVRIVVGRYADHPAVIGFQVDNEPGIMQFHNHAVLQRFRDELRRQYGSVTQLNAAWGLVYWSHRLSTWEDLWAPDGNYQPQYDLAWRTFQAKLTTEYIAWQAAIVREYARSDQFVMTCIAYDRATVHDSALTKALDVTAGNPYYAMQDALTVPDPGAKPQGWTTAGAWTLFQSGDRLYSSQQGPYLVTETNAGAIGGPSVNFPGYHGQWRQAAWALVARGAEMIEYWHWHTNHFGTETYWVGILPHDQQPGRVYRELAQLGAELKQAGDTVVGLRPDASVGMVYSSRSKWGLAFQAPFNKAGTTFTNALDELDDRSYQRIFEALYRGAFEARVPVRILHDDQLVAAGGGLDPSAVAAELPVLVAAGLLVADDELLTWLRSYAEAGGHLVLGIRTAYGDAEGRARTEVKPALLAEAAGVSYQEMSNLNEPLPVTSNSPDFVLGADSHASRWVDCLVADGAETLVGYRHPHFGQFAAVTTHQHGRGRITTVGTVPDQRLAQDLMKWLVPDPLAEWGELAPSVTVTSATTAAGGRLHVVHNWGWAPQSVRLPWSAIDVLDRDSADAAALELTAWDVRVLLQQE